ncbi:LysE family translocator [Roseovarius tibetensis]|uniref:LysE family translocator n=1 Tax=Roseovarius tibetensis TaxID=2685897 RepID=UPI003D7F60E8
MLIYSAEHWITFLTAAVLLNVSPGPDITFILGHTAKGGTRSGIAAMLGIWTGAFGHVILAALGLTAILETSETAFLLLKWAGVGYLLWIGIQAVRSDADPFLSGGAPGGSAFWSIFRQGALIDLLNPKVAVFFLAFLPQFVVADAGPAWLQLLAHGGLIIVVAAIIEPPLILLGARITGAVRTKPGIAVWLDRALGVVLISLALKLAALQR